MQNDVEQVRAEVLEPLDEWVHVQPSLDEEKRGRIFLPAGVGVGQLTRAIVLAVGASVVDIHIGDLVLVHTGEGHELRDGSRLVRREHLVARLQE